MDEADNHLKLLPTSIFNKYTVFEHIDMLSMGIQYQPCTVIPTLLGSAVSLLFNLKAAQQGRRVLFSDEQKLLFKGGKKGFAKNTKLNFMRR
jgi:hypothetical protein